MPDRIYVTYTPTTFPGAFHTAIHYERKDAQGRLIGHFVIEVQPEAKGVIDKAIGVVEEITRRDGKATRLGRMNAEVTEVTSDKEKRFDPNSPYEEIAEGDDLSSHFARMQLYAHGVNRAGIAYRGSHQNSNSFASGALKAGRLPAATGVGRDPIGRAGELFEFFAPGLNDPLKAPQGVEMPTFDSRASEAPAAGGENRRYLTRRVAGQPPSGGANLPLPPPVPSGSSEAVTGEPMSLGAVVPSIPESPDRSAVWRSNRIARDGRGQHADRSRALFEFGTSAMPSTWPFPRFPSSRGDVVGYSNAGLFPTDGAVNTFNVPTGLSGSMAVAGQGPERPAPSVPYGSRVVNHDDELSWLIQLLSRRQR
jgi:hypothetical protein